VRIVFLGYDQDPRGVFQAHFEIRNPSDHVSLMVAQLPIQTNSGAGWRWSSPPRALSDSLMGVPGVWQQTVVGPTNTVWRVAFIARKVSTYRILERVTSWLRPRWVPRWVTDRMWGRYCFSEAIEPPVEPYPHYRPAARVPAPPTVWE
jgi:hypothetical protein